MTSIPAVGISLFNAQQIDTAKLKTSHVSEMPQDMYERVTNGQRAILENKYTKMPDTSGHKAYQEYAKVLVNGRVVAEIDNHGWTKTSNAIGGRIRGNLPNEANGVVSGPALAQARAEYIAGMLGGQVVKSSTAISQREFSALDQPKPKVDTEAMQNDPGYAALMKTEQARTEFLAKQIAAQDSQKKAQEAEATQERSAVDEFMDYMNKTPEERYYEAILREMGLTEEELKALPPDERAKVEEEIKEEIAKRMAMDVHNKSEKDKEAAA